MTKLRSKVFVDSTVQGALARRIVLHWLVFFALSGLSLFTIEYFLGNVELTAAEHLSVFWAKYGLFFVLMIAIMPSFIYDAIKLSHRFAGPIMRLKSSMKSLADNGSATTLKFREGDYWRELSDDFNRVADRMSQSSTADRSP